MAMFDKDTEKELEKRAKELDEQENKLNKFKNNLLEKEKKLKEDMKKIINQNNILKNREFEIRKRELNAKEGFKKEALEQFNQKTILLNKEIEDLENDLLNKKREIRIELLNIKKENKEFMEREQEGYKEKLKNLELKISDKNKELKVLDKDLLEREKRLQKKEKFLIDRERIILIKENDAKEGFVKENEKATLSLKSELNDLNKQKENLIKELNETRTKQLKELDNIRENDRKAFFLSFEKERRELIKEIEKEKADLKMEYDKFKEEKKKFVKYEEELQVKYQEKENRINIQRRELDYEQGEIESKKEEIREHLENKFEAELDNLKIELDAKIQTIESYKDSLIDLNEKIESFEELKVKLENKEPNEILRDLRSKEKKIERLKEELFNRPSIKEIKELDFLKEQKNNDDEKIRGLLEKISSLEIENSRSIKSVIELEGLREQLKISKIRLEKYKKDVAELENDLKKYTESPSATREARIGVIKEPLKDFVDIRKNSYREENEIDWLNNIFKKMEESGFKFNERLVKAFHTSLKISEWSPLTVLAGVSGTGKSELPRLYSRFGGIQFAPIAVQPNWDSSQDMFGFFNYMEQKFNPKQLLRAMAQSQRDSSEGNGFNDGILLVLLDEMNLAKIEQYFSDLLSKLELRRGQQSVEIDIDLGSGEKYSLNLGRNILYVGTMNEDESTMTLSDKAIDRSNVISFPSPRKFHQRNTLKMAGKSGVFKFETWRSWGRSVETLPKEKRAKFKKIVEDINDKIRFAGRAIGHRVYQGIENYIANHPDVCELTKEDGELKDKKNQQKYDFACQRAFEDQIVQKIMPKLRGIETEGDTKKECIEPIARIISKHAEALSKDYKMASTKGYGVFNWNTAEYLENLEDEIEERGKDIVSSDNSKKNKKE